MHAARAEPGRMHSRTARALKEVHAIFAQIHDPQVRRKRTHIQNMGTHVEHVVGNASQLCKQHSQILCPLWHFQIEQFFDRKNV